MCISKSIVVFRSLRLGCEGRLIVFVSTYCLIINYLGWWLPHNRCSLNVISFSALWIIIHWSRLVNILILLRFYNSESPFIIKSPGGKCAFNKTTPQSYVQRRYNSGIKINKHSCQYVTVLLFHFTFWHGMLGDM